MRLTTALTSALLLLTRVSMAQDSRSNVDVEAPAAPTPPENVQTSEFQSDAARLLRVVGSALYHDKSAFLRELISNAADAIEKMRVVALKEGIQDLHEFPLNVTIRPVKDGRLIITDSGIGMDKTELANNLGTIARSGTSEFLSRVSSSSAVNAEQASGLIGKFGLGFYSSFLVAQKVVVASKSYRGNEQWVFESAGSATDSDGGSFKLYADPRGNTLGNRGTEITLWLNDDAREYLNTVKLKQLVQQHAEFSTGDAPIFVWTEEVVSEVNEVEAANPAGEEGSEKLAVVRTDWKRINDQPPIWMKDPKALSDIDYHGFYKATFRDEAKVDPLLWSHFKGDAGTTAFRAMIYLPGQFSHEFYSKSYQDLGSLRLYVRRVYITGDLGPNFIPKWLNWLKDDLPLNVGRDSLQSTASIMQIKRTITRKTVDMLTSAAKSDSENYNNRIWPVVGTALKIGTIEDSKNQAKIAKLLRFDSSSTTNASMSLDEYVAKRKRGQEQIYYMAGAGLTKSQLQKSPFVETLLARGYEVLYFTEPLDEMIASQLRNFDGMPFQDVAKKGLKYGDEAEDENRGDEAAAFQPLVDFLKAKLSTAIKEVVLSNRLTTSPCAIVADQMAWSANMEKIAAAQNSKAGGQGDDYMQTFFKTQKKILEINPRHPLIEGLLDKISEFSDDPLQAEKDDDLDELVNILYDTSLVKSGFAVRDPSTYFQNVERILRRSLGVSETAKAIPEYQPAPPVEEGPFMPRAQQAMPGGMPSEEAWPDWQNMKDSVPPAEGMAEELDLSHDEL